MATLLRPDERPLALQHAAYFSGEEDLGQPRPRFDAETVVDMAFGWPTPYYQAMADRWVSGTSLIGWPGCEAQGLAAVIDGNDLLLTDRRVLVVDLTDAADPRVRWERDRMQVASVRRAPRLGQAGRIWVLFADGSATSLMLGILSPAGAKAVVAAWGEIPGG